MIISEKQILALMRLARGYYSLCAQMNWEAEQIECRNLLRELESQQSEELKVVE